MNSLMLYLKFGKRKAELKNNKKLHTLNKSHWFHNLIVFGDMKMNKFKNRLFHLSFNRKT